MELQMVEVEELSLNLGQMHLEELVAVQQLRLPCIADSIARMRHNLRKLHTDPDLHSTVRIGQHSQLLVLDCQRPAQLELLGSKFHQGRWEQVSCRIPRNHQLNLHRKSLIYQELCLHSLALHHNQCSAHSRAVVEVCS